MTSHSVEFFLSGQSIGVHDYYIVAETVGEEQRYDNNTLVITVEVKDPADVPKDLAVVAPDVPVVGMTESLTNLY